MAPSTTSSDAKASSPSHLGDFVILPSPEGVNFYQNNLAQSIYLLMSILLFTSLCSSSLQRQFSQGSCSWTFKDFKNTGTGK